MKKVLLFIGALTMITLSSCTSRDEPTPKEDVKFTLTYDFVESGSMSRSAEDVYTSFYNSYIKNKKLTPKKYNLTFTNVETGVSTKMIGRWDSSDAISLIEGDYSVTGTSYPSGNAYALDSVSLTFDETIHLSKETTSIKLTAKYDSFLLLINSANKTSVYADIYHYNQTTANFIKIENLYYGFMKSASDYNYLEIVGDNNFIKIDDFRNMPFEKGKYYYFDDMTNSFDIPLMGAGY